ncbi:MULTISPECIES: FecR family protein [unclassified Rhizobium]|uniref:FecR family protein n=1 Tax=unclassified Rhizobium TaxID=2613769 RepID=UPI00177D19CA|nr:MULTISPECIES: FecR domain-containing protein [unclassified Rhizobium]MBD8688382.1 FecR domain-containing protein [Rhizobium sp. CFBP 13644]MBD8692837.1 FecR domain-containing protein [Rhizobium sp. CFBP 13717]
MVSMNDNLSDHGDYKHADPVTDQALEWFITIKVGGEPTAAELETFQVWLAACPSHADSFERVKNLWTFPETLVASKRLQDEYDTVGSTTGSPKEPTNHAGVRRRYAFAAAASILLIAGTSQMMLVFLRLPTADFTTQVGEISTVQLPDGTTMQLNSDSAVALDFSATKRGVRIIQGEAWFDVVHNETAPFRVNGQFSTTTVTGTAFDVRVGTNNDTVKLERGSVYLTHKREEIRPVHLLPGQTARATEQGISDALPTGNDETMAWREGRIVFTEKPLREALDEISRYWNSQVFVLNRSILDIPVSGNYRVESAKDALNGIVSAVGGKVTFLPGGITIIR